MRGCQQKKFDFLKIFLHYVTMKKIFSKTNIIIIILIVLFVSLAVVFYMRAHDRNIFPEQDQPLYESEKSLEEIKKQIDFEAPGFDEVERQKLELENLKQ